MSITDTELGIVICVSHDRYFLNKVCTHILDIDYEKITLFIGNYDFWYESSELALKQMKEAKKKKEDEPQNLWQEEDFLEPHGLKPCAYQTVWNVRYGKDGERYLDMCLFQRSSDYLTAGCINQVQYCGFLIAVANHLGYTPGKFTWNVANVQIYDRHIEQAHIMLNRNPIICSPKIIINPNKSFWDLEVDDFRIEGFPKETIKEKNPQLKFDIGI